MFLFVRNCSPRAQFARRNRQRRTPLMQFEGLDFAHLHPSCATGDLCRLDVCPSHMIWKSCFSICVDPSRRLQFVNSKCATLPGVVPLLHNLHAWGFPVGETTALIHQFWRWRCTRLVLWESYSGPLNAIRVLGNQCELCVVSRLLVHSLWLCVLAAMRSHVLMARIAKCREGLRLCCLLSRLDRGAVNFRGPRR